MAQGMTHSPLSEDEKTGDMKDSTCPFSMTFQRYRIPLTRGKEKTGGAMYKLGFLSELKTSLDRAQLERKYSNAVKEGLFIWIEASSGLSIPERSEEKNELVWKGSLGVHVSAIYWRTLSDLADSVIGTGGESRTVVLCLPNSSLMGLKQLVDISNWLEEMSMEDITTVAPKAIVHAVVDEEAPVPTVLFTATSHTHGNVEDNLIEQKSLLTSDVVEKRMKSWVTRILVRMQICPFTKSNSKSGQGLGDFGVPVARIAYHYSSASKRQIYHLMADTWEAIFQMINAGSSGKDGISSILLAAPEFDNNFRLWAGPIFAMLEANVCAASAEQLVGVVCFHPRYVVPDGNSWPGFGQMHSVPRLRKWLSEYDEGLLTEMSDSDIAAGGAWQRRTPHSTINVLRADQLEVAEGKRVSGSLYSLNIRKLYKTGFAKLDIDLKKDIHIGNA